MTADLALARQRVDAASTVEDVLAVARDVLRDYRTTALTERHREVSLIEETVERDSEQVSVARRAQAALFAAGLAWLAGPRELGGGGRPAGWQLAVDAVVDQSGLPSRAPLMIGLDIVAPAIEAHGDEGLRRRYLPAIHSGDLVGCQLFSEPGSGSDLAGARTSAVRDGDEWIVNGQKVWTSMAHVADIGELLVRTDPAAGKHAGLSMLLVDMRAPGVTVRPLRQMTGGAAFNEVFLADVRVPVADMVGAAGNGWQVAATSLNSERLAMMRGAGPLTPAVLTRYADLVARTGSCSADVGRAVAAAVAAGALAARRPGSWGRLEPVAGSLSKLALVDALMRMDDSLPELLGPALHGGGDEVDDWSAFTLGVPGLRLAGGTDEIHLNLVAQRGLGLPR